MYELWTCTSGIINTALSAKFVLPLSKLTYCAFLVHVPIINFFYLSQTSTLDFSDSDAVSQ